MRRKLVLAVAGATLLNVAQLYAHHSFSAKFDAKRPVKFRATVIKMEWINPHAWIHVEVKGPDCKVVTWVVEAGTPNTLFRRGFSKNSLAPGTEILVEVYQAKDGSNKANGRDVTFPDGRKLFLGSSGTVAPDEPSHNALGKADPSSSDPDGRPQRDSAECHQLVP